MFFFSFFLQRSQSLLQILPRQSYQQQRIVRAEDDECGLRRGSMAATRAALVSRIPRQDYTCRQVEEDWRTCLRPTAGRSEAAVRLRVRQQTDCTNVESRIESCRKRTRLPAPAPSRSLAEAQHQMVRKCEEEDCFGSRCGDGDECRQIVLGASIWRSSRSSPMGGGSRWRTFVVINLVSIFWSCVFLD